MHCGHARNAFSTVRLKIISLRALFECTKLVLNAQIGVWCMQVRRFSGSPYGTLQFFWIIRCRLVDLLISRANDLWRQSVEIIWVRLDIGARQAWYRVYRVHRCGSGSAGNLLNFPVFSFWYVCYFYFLIDINGWAIPYTLCLCF